MLVRLSTTYRGQTYRGQTYRGQGPAQKHHATVNQLLAEVPETEKTAGYDMYASPVRVVHVMPHFTRCMLV